ncbi:hypothetical protein BD413DRAFT_480888 [Trametes elegans]|nr:hypothetical protein BD413DRAFT_480888 [Trametes elegans]
MLWTVRPPSLTLRAWTLPCRASQRSFSFSPHRRLPPTLAEGIPKPPVFREEVLKAKELPSFSDAVRNVPVRKQIWFVVAGTVGALVVGAHLTNYELFKWWTHIAATPNLRKNRPPTSEELARVKYYVFGRRLQAGLASLKSSIEQLPETVKAVVTWSYVQVFQPILNASEGKRMCWAIGAVNLAVWAAWRVPRWNAFMIRSFTHNALSGRSYTLLTSVFSHDNIFHLAFNCMALASFGAAACQQLIIRYRKVEEQRGVLSEPSPKWHLLALFVSAGLFSSLVSHVAYARWQYPRLIARLKTASSPSGVRAGSSAASSSAGPASGAAAEAVEGAVAATANAAHQGKHSLGSSGAIYAMLAITTLGFPDAEITLVIPPWFPINIQTGFAAIVALDVVGILRGWRLFDHYAHLGGAAFGMFWYEYGAQIWYTVREWDLPVAFFFHGGALKKAGGSPPAAA